MLLFKDTALHMSVGISLGMLVCLSPTPCARHTVDGFIFVGTNFRGLNKKDTFVGFKIHGHCIYFHNAYRKLPFRGY